MSGCVALLPVGDKPMDSDLLGQTGLCSCCPRAALGLSWSGGVSELQPRHVDMYTCAVGWGTWEHLNYQRRGGRTELEDNTDPGSKSKTKSELRSELLTPTFLTVLQMRFPFRK